MPPIHVPVVLKIPATGRALILAVLVPVKPQTVLERTKGRGKIDLKIRRIVIF